MCLDVKILGVPPECAGALVVGSDRLVLPENALPALTQALVIQKHLEYTAVKGQKCL